MSSLSSSIESEETRPSAPRAQRATEETLLQAMMCWLVSQGSNAMKEALKNHTSLAPRTDLGDQAVRIAEVREMTAAAYAAGKPTRVQFWYGKFRRMKTTMRQKVDEHLNQCSIHKNYKIRRDAIDTLREETSGSETDSPVRKSEKIATPDKAKSGSVSSAPGEKFGGILRAKNSGTASDGAPGRKLGQFLYTENSESGLDRRGPVKKRKAIVRMMTPESGLDDESPVKKRGRIDIAKIEPLQSDENPPSKKQRVVSEL